MDYLSRWEGLSKEEYKAQKKKQTDDLVDRLEKLIPGAKENIEYLEASTPVTMKRFTANHPPRGNPITDAIITAEIVTLSDKNIIS